MIFLAALALAAPTALAVSIALAPVGHAGNLPDQQGDRTIGGVDYEFEIGKYEVTNAQYTEFLNLVDPSGANARGLYNSLMTSDARGGINFSAAAASGAKYAVKADRGNNPVVFVSFFDAARFTNWLHNGQGGASTEDGSYQLSGGTPIPANGDFVTRKVTATWVLPTADEWYKAAFHQNDGATANYWDYPTRANTAPASDQPPGSSAPAPANTANFFAHDELANGYNDGYAVTGSPVQVPTTNYLTNVGAYTLAAGPYGTFDQGGNVWEWLNDSPALEARNVAGGSWINSASYLAAASVDIATAAANEANTIGFRVARVPAGVLAGDYNGNGNIDAADYTIWRDTLGSTTDLRANGDDTGASAGRIDAADYTFWKNLFAVDTGGGGPIGPSGLALTVPEPATLPALFAAVPLALTLGRRRLVRH